MGSETTSVLWTELFTKRKDAVQYAIQYCEKDGKVNQWVIDAAKELNIKNSVDAYCWGFSIVKKEVN